MYVSSVRIDMCMVYRTQRWLNKVKVRVPNCCMLIRSATTRICWYVRALPFVQPTNPLCSCCCRCLLVCRFRADVDINIYIVCCVCVSIQSGLQKMLSQQQQAPGSASEAEVNRLRRLATDAEQCLQQESAEAANDSIDVMRRTKERLAGLLAGLDVSVLGNPADDSTLRYVSLSLDIVFKSFVAIINIIIIFCSLGDDHEMNKIFIVSSSIITQV